MKKCFVLLTAMTVSLIPAPAANAQAAIVSCSRLCWTPLAPTTNSSFECFVKMINQAKLDDYNRYYNSGAFNSGKKVFFFALPNGDKVSCGNSSAFRPIAVLGKMLVTLTAHATGPASLGSTQNLYGGNYTYDYQNTLFFPDPSQD